jgi:transcriptional regulator with XRE-family HTH domain
VGDAADGGQARRTELGAFLRARRSQMDRAAVGLPDVGRRRTGGLRREEVAALSGVSVTWYTWLEQARDVTPSRQVLQALAGTLNLTGAERAYLLSLAGYIPAATDPEPVPRAPDHLQRLIDGLDAMPAYVIAHDWTICGWNRAYQELYPNVARVPDADRNLLWLVFTDPAVRDLLPDWNVTSRHFLAEFHAETVGRLGSPAVARLVARLSEHSAEFRTGWNDHAVEGFSSRLRTFHTPAGDLVFEHHRLAPADHQDLHVVIYTPAADRTTELVRRLKDDG